MLSRYIEQALKMFNDVDGILVFDEEGIIRYFYTAHPDICMLKGTEILGKKVTEVYPELTDETSYVMRSLKTGEPYLNYIQEVKSFRDTSVKTITSTIPIHEKSQVVGVLEFCIYLNKKKKNKQIDSNLSLDRVTKAATDKELYHLHDIITENPAMLELKERISSNDASDAPVLVYGRTGTGKELIVKATHQCSRRRKGPLVTQNCAAIPSTLLESILFGTVKGSFTGARDCEGLFEMADGGTLFLDEINSMEIGAQAKLLRAIEEKKVRRLGSTTTKDVDVRIIAAINEDPLACIREKRIREDLYYRISVIRYDIPELRERREDIELLMEYFRLYFNEMLNRNILAYSSGVKELFLQYDWPGNVRELKNAIESAFQLNFGAFIELHHLPPSLTALAKETRPHYQIREKKSLEEMVGEFEKSIITEAYRECGGSLTKTAEMLQLTKQGLWYKMKKYNLS